MAPPNPQIRNQPGSRRPSLTHLAERWRNGERREVGKITERAFRAFSAEIVGQKPQGLRGYPDALDLYGLYRDEILAAIKPPFDNSHDPIEARSEWREVMIAVGFIIPVPYEDDILHVQEMFLYGLRITTVVFDGAWESHWARQFGGRAPHDSWTGRGNDDREQRFYARLRKQAQDNAADIRYKIENEEPLSRADLLNNPPLSWHSATAPASSNPVNDRKLAMPKPAPASSPATTVNSADPKDTSGDNWGAPPAKPDPSEPFMRDGSHLLASERGRRRIDPVTGKRMIRHMVLTPDAWPHYEWIEDIEGEFGVGPHGPDCGIWMPDDPNVLSPREAARPYLEKMGRMDLLHKFMPGPNDPDQSNPPVPHFRDLNEPPKQPK